MSTVTTGDNSWTSDQLAFQAWLSLPSASRSPKSQQAFSKELGVTEVTLSRWKRLPGWHDAVYALAMADLAGELVPVLQAQVREAKRGSLPHAQWLFELAGKWSPKTRHEMSGNDGAPLTFTISIDRRDTDDASDG